MLKAAQPSAVTDRLISLDAYRGFVMLAMASGGLGLARIAGRMPGSTVWYYLGYHFEHVEWRGCSFWDLIQPSFMFIVGVALPYSYANRRARGDSYSTLVAHAVWRSVVLVALAVFLASQPPKAAQTNYEFFNVLAQIGLGYTFVFLLLGRRPAVQFAVAIAILIGDWLLFARHPLPGRDFTWSEAGGYLAHGHRPLGFFAHWDKNVNVASAFDRWFLNLFPMASGTRFEFNKGGYTTLNFFPSMATMIFGVLAGEHLRSPRSATSKVRGLLLASAAGIILGVILDATVCPMVKRIWTPSFAIYAAGWTCGLLALFYTIIDVLGYRRWTFPLVVVGANSIAMYMMAQLLSPFILTTLQTHLGRRIFEGLYGPIVASLAVLAVLWLICLWLYRRRIFLKV